MASKKMAYENMETPAQVKQEKAMAKKAMGKKAMAKKGKKKK